MSNISGHGVFDVKNAACKLLNDYRKTIDTEHIPSKTLKREE